MSVTDSIDRSNQGDNCGANHPIIGSQATSTSIMPYQPITSNTNSEFDTAHLVDSNQVHLIEHEVVVTPSDHEVQPQLYTQSLE